MTEPDDAGEHPAKGTQVKLSDLSVDEAEILTTKSINSPVFLPGDPDPEAVYDPNKDAGKSLYDMHHVTLLDLDGYSMRYLSDTIANKPGVNVVLRSSEGSWHVWNLTVRPRLEVCESQVLCKDDEAHIRNGLERGYWRLRIGPKVRNNKEDEIYKERPQLETLWLNPSDRPQSLPHWRAARALWDIPELPEEMGYAWKGSAHSVESYHTITDKLKSRWSGGGE